MDVHSPTWYRVRSLSTQLQLIKSLTFSLLSSNLNSILENQNQRQLKIQNKHLTQHQHFRSTFPLSQQRKRKEKPILQRQQGTKERSISRSALKMARAPFTSFPFVLIILLSIVHLSHCKTLKRDGNINFLTQPHLPMSFSLTFSPIRSIGSSFWAFSRDGSESFMWFLEFLQLRLWTRSRLRLGGEWCMRGSVMTLVEMGIFLLGLVSRVPLSVIIVLFPSCEHRISKFFTCFRKIKKKKMFFFLNW